MMSDKNGVSKKRACPVAFGVALGLTLALSVIIWGLWLMYGGQGGPDMMPGLGWGDVLTRAGFMFVKGFVFGFFLILFYNKICCFCPCKCCKSACCGCGKENCTCNSNKKA